MSNNTLGIVSIDGIPPIYAPDGRWAIFSYNEIFLGREGSIAGNPSLRRYVPKVNDWVIVPSTGEMFIVTDLDPVTFVPELTAITFRKSITVDELTSSTNDNYRIYYDKSITPFTLAVDGFMRVYSTTATVARIYKGTFIDPTKIISRRYDNSGNFIGHDIPLQLVAFNSHDNYAIKSIPTCNTNVELQTGDTCTVVIFDASGKVISKVTCIIEDTTFVAQAYSEQKYITQIFIKSVFIDSLNTSDINYPVNLPVNSFNPIGVVQYNDGTQIEYPVDGGKFKLFGLDQFVSTIIGHKVPLVLSYRMDSNESAIAAVTNDSFFVTRPYNLVVSNPNRSYNVKLFVYPVWIDSVNGYKYKVFMMNLDRNLIFDVTNIVSLASNSPAFNPVAYGITQRLILAVNLSSVSGIYNDFLHVQTVDIVLRGAASDTSVVNIWEVSSQVPSSVPYFGAGLRAVRDGTTNNKITISNNIQTVAEFINRLYRTTAPLHNPVTETEAPTPTHIEVVYLNESVFLPITSYTNQITFNTIVQPFSNIDIIFHRETITGYLKLSVCSITVR